MIQQNHRQTIKTPRPYVDSPCEARVCMVTNYKIVTWLASELPLSFLLVFFETLLRAPGACSLKQT